MQSSGKLVIIGILGIALAAAGASWWFRYTSTHRAAQFWGREVAQLIRDASGIELCRLQIVEPVQPQYSALQSQLIDCHDISKLPGITHLRNALLEDRSFRWPTSSVKPDAPWKWVLRFQDESTKDEARIYFSSDWRYVLGRDDVILSTEPIATGLNTMFAELLSPTGEGIR
jgi:hypothetical protein